MRRRRLGRLAVLGGVIGAAVCSALALAGQSTAQYPYPPSPSTSMTPAPSHASSSKHKVTIQGTSLSTYKFHPRTLKVKKGSTVNWSWDSNAPHNVTFSGLGKHSATGSSGSYKLKFTKRGTFKYLCTIHHFTGKIVVK